MRFRIIFPACLLSLLIACPFHSAAHAATAPAGNNGTYTLGVEGFHDRYREPDPAVDVTDRTNYGSVTLDYQHAVQNNYFTAVEGRASYGKDRYSSPDGQAKGAPQYEADIRLLGGKTAITAGGQIKPYIGLGARLFEDHGAGLVTNLGFAGYDRRIAQLYLPVGVSYGTTIAGLSVTPKAEYDALLYGRVNSRLQDIGGPNVVNTQNPLKGYGLRGEIMVGHKNGGRGWDIGPFVRYWHIEDSTVNQGYYEPTNTRFQAGGTLRYTF